MRSHCNTRAEGLFLSLCFEVCCSDRQHTVVCSSVSYLLLPLAILLAAVFFLLQCDNITLPFGIKRKGWAVLSVLSNSHANEQLAEKTLPKTWNVLSAPAAPRVAWTSHLMNASLACSLSWIFSFPFSLLYRSSPYWGRKLQTVCPSLASRS